MMKENYKGRSTCFEEDKINNLPEHLVSSILERLPIQDAARTSILSKRWRYTWTTMRALVFDERFSEKFAINGALGRNGFIRIINQVLFLHKGPISKFHLHIPNIFLDSFQEVTQWMSFLSRNGVRELVVTNSNQRYELTSYVFSCQELRMLELGNCFFKPPLDFEGFLNLEDLHLKNIDFLHSLSGTPINLPKLKMLSLNACTYVFDFNIDAKNLQKLVVMNCPDAKLLRLLKNQCLTLVGIVFQKPKLGDHVQVERINLATMLSCLPRIVRFYINGYCLKSLTAEKIPKRLPHTVDSLEGLWLRSIQLGDLDQLHGALCLLRNSPNLERLVIILMQMRNDMVPTSNHLGTLISLDQTMNRLRTVEITSLEGSMAELFFIKLVLARSPSLEKLTIRPSGTCDALERINVAQNVMGFPRASLKAEIIYLDLQRNP